jgi:hypothetical protein
MTGGNRLSIEVAGALVLLCACCWAQPHQTAEEKLAAGERVVEGYSSEDVLPTSAAEFNRGVALIEQALRENVKDRRRALLALVEAGRTGPGGANPTPKRLGEVFRELLRSYPRDPELLMKYAAHLQNTGPKAALPAYLHVLDVQPDNAEALFIVAGYHQDAGEVATAVEELIRAVRLKSADADMIQVFVSGFVTDLNALGNSQFVPRVSAAVFEALAAQARAGNTKAAFVSAALRVEFGEVRAGVEEFLGLLRQDSVDGNMIRDGLESITRYLSADEHENAQYIEQVSAAAAEALKARAKKER